VSGQLNATAALPLGKEPLVPNVVEVVWAPEPVWTIWKSENSWPYRNLNPDPLVAKPIVSRYTNYIKKIIKLCFLFYALEVNVVRQKKVKLFL
jgi:hypothetical protein